MKTSLGFAVIGIVSALTPLEASRGVEMDAPPIGTTIIQNEAGYSRVLFPMNGFTSLVGKSVGIAYLEIPLSGAVADHFLEIRAYPVMSPWVPGFVSWDGWGTPGGDIDPEIYTRIEIDFSRGISAVELDMSLILSEFAAGLEIYGILLTVPPDVAEGFSPEELILCGAFSAATFQVQYRNRPSVAPADVIVR